MDRGYDSKSVFEMVQIHGMNYIIRSEGKMSLIVNCEEHRFRQVAKSVKLEYQFQKEDSDQYLKCGAQKVSVRLNPYPVKNPETLETWLIVAQPSPDKRGREGYFYLFCDFPSEPNLSVPELINKALKMYHQRWKIEEMHRHLKQEYGWEKI